MSDIQTGTAFRDGAPGALLITQCLQNDFVQPLERYDGLPNQLHVGYDEALRLIGEDPERGPVQTVMEWAYEKVGAHELGLIHIRDWHNAGEERQQEHLRQFGPHCLRDSPGADFVFRTAIKADRPHHIVDASGLNDFVDTNLAEILDAAAAAKQKVRVGVMGVWTEAKVAFLAYDLTTRYPNFEVAVCSALTASSSRAAHFTALDQMQSVLGVRVFTSVSAFTEFLTGSAPAIETRLRHARVDGAKLELPAGYELKAVDRDLLLYLFRDAKSVGLSVLDGGFSGNVVMGARSRDGYGHAQVPHVVKIGERDMIARERTAFEKIQEVLGNSAPNIVDFAELQNRGAIKYRYAGMLEGNVRTFQKLYGSSERPDELSEVFRVLDVVFGRQLGRFYEAASRERLNLLAYYDYQPKYAPGVRRRVEALLGRSVGEDPEVEIIPGVRVPNVCMFYERDLNELRDAPEAAHYVAYVHGDLNGANILLDDSDNVWLIDFFHTHRGHVIKDLVKLENDLLYIFMKIETEEEFREAVALVDLVLSGEDLGVPPDAESVEKISGAKFRRAYLTIRRLRSFYPDLIHLDRDPYQFYAAAVRYAMHTLAFDESNDWQKRLALYAGSICADRVRTALRLNAKLRVDQIPFPGSQHQSGAIGLTILPGRKDRGRDLGEDLAVLKAGGYQQIVCLITRDEFERYGVKDLAQQYAASGFDVRYFPIPDQGVSQPDAMHATVDWMHEQLTAGRNVLLHCVGGLGRSGTVAACYLVKYGDLAPAAAIEAVRQARSPRAIETRRQSDFIRSFGA